jgi:hypothetical protein
MATAYVGVRPILAGVDVDSWVHYWKNKVGTYSNWSLQNTGSKVLTGFPDNERTLGTDGKVRKARFLELIFTGKQPLSPMDGSGGGTRITGMRFRPLEYKGTLSGSVFPSGYGHALRTTAYSVYTNFVYDGLGSDILAGSGHAHRIGVSYGGAFEPYFFHGVPSTLAMPGTVGQANTTSVYGRAKVNEWKGVLSSKAL